MNNRQYLKLLLVSNDRSSLNMNKEYFNNIGYTDVDVFNRVESCLDQLTMQPTLVFIENEIDTLTGLVLLKMMKKINSEIQVVFVSFNKNSKTVDSLLKHGAFDFIVKDENELENKAKVMTRIREVMAA